jgi:hypothetical protein
MPKRHRILVLAVALCALCGCDWRRWGAPAPAPSPPPSAAGPTAGIDPLPVQQAKAYPELSSGIFVSLADFEDAPGKPGAAQVERFHVLPGEEANCLRHVRHISRTGAGAMEVDLPPQSALQCADLPIHDFRPYTLLSLALHAPALRDDVLVILGSDKGSWTSHPMLVKPGWNTLLVDIQHLADDPRFDASAVKSVSLALAEASTAAKLYVDDLLLVENSRFLQPVPEGMRLFKVGLDYRIELPLRRQPMALAQSPDGLWRLGSAQRQPAATDQPAVQLAAPGKDFSRGAGAGEDLAIMGERRLGEAEVLEHNAVRLRLASTWYFPARGGEWASLSVRRIRWEHTFYGDGRWVVFVEVNNAGGDQIGSVRLLLPGLAAWPGEAKPAREKVVKDFAGTSGRWMFLLAPEGDDATAMREAYSNPPAIQTSGFTPAATAGASTDAAPKTPAAAQPAAGADRDGYDYAQGCYVLRAKAGRCRFTLNGRTAALVNPVFRIKGIPTGPVYVSSDGAAVRNVVRLEDGSVLFQLPGRIERSAAAEVVGEGN